MFDKDWDFETDDQAETQASIEVVQHGARGIKGAQTWIICGALFILLATVVFYSLGGIPDWVGSESALLEWIGSARNASVSWARANIEIILAVIGWLLLAGLGLVIAWYVMSEIYVWITGRELSELLENKRIDWATCLKILRYLVYLLLLLGAIVILRS